MRLSWLGFAVFFVLSGCARPTFSSPKGDLEAARSASPQAREAEAARDAAFREPVQARNATAEYAERYYESAQGMSTERAAKLTPCRVLLVHGLLGEVGLKVEGFLDSINKKQRLLDYFKDQRQALDDLGIKHEDIEFRSDTVERSGRKIMEAVLRSPEPVVLFSHSKGCVDTLDALRQLREAGKLSRVAGWISVQGVFEGAPKAARFVEHGGLRTVGIVTMRMLGGNFNAIRDLTPEARARYQETNKAALDEIAQKVPIVCFASWESPEAAPEPSKEAPPKEASAKETSAKESGARDETPPALVSAFKIAPRSSVLTGTDYVAKAGISHNETVIRSPHPFDREGFTRALFAMLSDRMGK